MPRNFLDSDDEDAWSSGDSQSSGSLGSPNTFSSFRAGSLLNQNQPDYRLFGDYFGLSNLLNNVKIAEDNELLYSQKDSALHSLGGKTSDERALLSHNHMGNMREHDFGLMAGKEMQPPSKRYISKAMRERIISGAYQQPGYRSDVSAAQEKFVHPPPLPPMQPSLATSHATQPPSMPPISAVPSSRVPMRPPVSQAVQPGTQCCVFCRNNKEDESVYTSHVLKDSEGRTVCPILRAYTCPICKANGDNSHTIKYCPENPSARFQLGHTLQQHPAIRQHPMLSSQMLDRI